MLVFSEKGMRIMKHLVNWSMRENDNNDDDVYDETIEGQRGPLKTTED